MKTDLKKKKKFKRRFTLLYKIVKIFCIYKQKLDIVIFAQLIDVSPQLLILTNYGFFILSVQRPLLRH